MSNSKLTLEKGLVYTLRIDDIQEKVKCFPSKEGLKCRHDILCTDNKGNSGIFEYCNFSETADAFVLKAWQQIRCKFSSDKGAEIEPVLDTPQQTTVAPVRWQDSQAPANGDNQYTVPLSGRSIAFAVGYAKDILCAEISTRPPGTVVTEEDIHGMLSNADIINNWMAERVKF